MDESFDVGVDTRTGVDDNDYQVPFRFTGKLDKLTDQAGSYESCGGKAAPGKGPRREKQGAVNRSASSMTPAVLSADSSITVGYVRSWG